MITKRHLLLINRCAVSPEAKVLLLEILLQFQAGNEMPTDAELSKLTGVSPKSVPLLRRELVIEGILERTVSATGQISFSFNADALASNCGYTCFDEVDFDSAMHGAHQEFRPREQQYDLSNERDLIAMFALLYRTTYGTKYSHGKKEHVRMKALREEYGLSQLSLMIQEFLTNRSAYRGSSPSIEGLWESRKQIARRFHVRGHYARS